MWLADEGARRAVISPSGPGLVERPKYASSGNAFKFTRTGVADRLHFHTDHRHLPGMKTPSTDRRTHERYDVLGALWGVLEMPETAHILNVSSTGLLIEAALNPVLNSVHAVRMMVEGDAIRVDTVVRHCRPGSNGRNLIGLEFLEVPTSLLTSIELVGGDKQIEVIDSGTSRS